MLLNNEKNILNKLNQENVNDLIPLKYRERINSQPCKIRNTGSYYPDQTIKEPYIYVLGLGETHYKIFDKEIQRICSPFPWTKSKMIRFIMNELITNTQFSMLRQIVHKIHTNQKAAGYFNVTVYPCKNFFSASIEEFGDFFDYYAYLDKLKNFDYANPKHYDSIKETVLKKDELLIDNHVKLVLNHDSNLRLVDGSNRIGLNVIERATDEDFYITSFYNKGQYMWKRIYFRVENN